MTSKIQNSPDSPISHNLFAKESELLTQSHQAYCFPATLEALLVEKKWN